MNALSLHTSGFAQLHAWQADSMKTGCAHVCQSSVGVVRDSQTAILQKLPPQATALAIAWRDGAKGLQGHGPCCMRMGQQGFWGQLSALGPHRCNQAPVARTIGENQLCQLCILLRCIDSHAQWWIRSLCGCRNCCQSASSP